MASPHGINRSKISAGSYFSAGERQAAQTAHGAATMPVHSIARRPPVCYSPQSGMKVRLSCTGDSISSPTRSPKSVFCAAVPTFEAAPAYFQLNPALTPPVILP